MQDQIELLSDDRCDEPSDFTETEFLEPLELKKLRECTVCESCLVRRVSITRLFLDIVDIAACIYCEKQM
jgi:hypothetical protein